MFDSKSKPKSVKYKLDKLAFFLLTGSFPKDAQKILHKNLEENDNRAINLTLVSRAVYNKIKESSKNLDSGIRIVNHPTDQHSHLLHWFEGGTERTKVVEDIVVAKKMKTRLQLKSMKFLTRYCIFE